MTFINYSQIVEDMVTLLVNSDIEFDLVADHMEDYERTIGNTSYCNIMLSRANNEIMAGNNYTNRVTFQLEIAALDLSSKREAVTIRDGLVNEVQDLLRTNQNFSANLETVVLTEVDFEVNGGIGEDEEQSFTATALVTVEAIVYSQ